MIQLTASHKNTEKQNRQRTFHRFQHLSNLQIHIAIGFLYKFFQPQWYAKIRCLLLGSKNVNNFETWKRTNGKKCWTKVNWIQIGFYWIGRLGVVGINGHRFWKVLHWYYWHCLGVEREFNDHQHKPSASKLKLRQYLIKNQDHVNDASAANPIAAVYALNILSARGPD